MSEEILINVTPMETRVALIENGLLQEIFIERPHSKGHVGDIYLGKVVRVMPGMEAAFIDIGLERAAFIHSADIAPVGPDGFEIREEPAPTIESLVREGQMIVVQVAKDPIGSKGARLTTHLTLPSRNLVYLPRSKHIGISQRLENEEERTRLLAMIDECIREEDMEGRGGFIIRTAAEGCAAEEMIEDVRFLKKLWVAVERRVGESRDVHILYRDVPLYMRAMRDLITPHIEKIRIDTQSAFDEISRFIQDFIPECRNNVELYAGERPIFDLYGIEEEINKALGRQVKLKSGGDLIIDQTEAMTTVDVNTGAYLGSKNHAETILKTNLEAATAIARQLRVRNLGGIIILDFIDMLDPEHQRQVLRTLSKALEKDHARTTITGMSELGLVEMTRKRTRESLGQLLCSECVVCKGRGRLKTAETICYEIFREIMRVARVYENDVILVMASQRVVDRLLDEESSTLADLEELIGKTVRFEVEPMYTQEQFDVVLF
ncbi:MAG: ribonuclease G [Gammaproteobacteria bacterium]|nr:ribonuclease G [Gammaproteobacteria bacterium]MDP2141671.1 ribonuclease G [Gammaproteobacteria bacterium]MDP2347906.1 ribonuclease G [Gammaproteobacteria bacterium]